MAKTPNDVASKWSKALGASGEQIKLGVNAVTRSPGEAAAAKKGAYIDGVLEKADKWERNVKAVKLEDWRTAVLTTGLQRLQSGANKGMPKMEKFMTQWLPYEEGLKSQLKNMPKGGIENSIARATAAIRYNAAFIRNP